MDGTLNFTDLIKKRFIEDFSLASNTLNVSRVLLTLALAFAIGLFIFNIYKHTFNGVLYSRNFNISLIMLTMVTALIIMPMTSNLTLSLGMVGALSIVRFRTAVKDPIDTVFMFWAIAVGITTGASFYFVAIGGSAIIGLILYLLSAFKFKGRSPYLLVLRYAPECANEVKYKLNQLPPHKLKSQSVTRDGVELTIEINLKDESNTFVSQFLQIPGVRDAALVSYQGDYVS